MRRTSRHLIRALASLRVRIVAVVLLAAVPALVLLWREGADHRHDLRAAEADQALHVARILGGVQARRLESVVAELRVLLANYPGDAARAVGCAAEARSQVSEVPGVRNLGIATPSGDVVCSAVQPAARGITFADREWFARVGASGAPTVGEFVSARIVGWPVIPVAVGRTVAGRVVAVGFAGLDPAYLRVQLAPIGLPEHTRVLVLDSRLRVFAGYPEALTQPAGTPMGLQGGRGRPIDASSGYLDGRDRQGDAIVGAYARVPFGTPEHRPVVFVGVTDEGAIASANQLLWLALAGTLLCLVAALALGWAGGGVLVVRPARAIAATARRLAAGDLEARTEPVHAGGELALLARDVDTMAESLAERTRALDRERRRYKALIENLPALVFDVTGTGDAIRVTLCNDPAGTGLADVPQSLDEWLVHVHEDDRERYRTVARRVSELGLPLEIAYRRLLPDGSIRWFRGASRSVEGAEEEALRVGFHFDVTEEVEREREIVQAAERVQELAGVARDVLAAGPFDEAAQRALGAVRRVLPVTHACVGVWHGEEAGGRCVALYPSASREVRPIPLQRAILDHGSTLRVSGPQTTFFVPLRAEATTLGAMALTIEREHVDAETLEFVTGIAHQLALGLQREQLVAQLRRQAEELEERVAERTAELREANGELSQFATTVAHDLRAPLRSMRGFSTALLEDHAGALGDEGADFARRIAAGAQSMDQLIDDLLAYARMGSGTRVELEQVDLHAVAREAEERVAGDVRRSGAVIDLGRPLGRVLGSRQLLVVVLSNLIQNAVTFTAPGVPPAVRLRTEQRGTTVRICVDDEGIGVADKDRERIFEVFERVHPRHVYPGTGVGLAIVAKAAARMGGRAGVDARPGGGSTFWVELAAGSGGEDARA